MHLGDTRLTLCDGETFELESHSLGAVQSSQSTA